MAAPVVVNGCDSPSGEKACFNGRSCFPQLKAGRALAFQIFGNSQYTSKSHYVENQIFQSDQTRQGVHLTFHTVHHSLGSTWRSGPVGENVLTPDLTPFAHIV